MRKPWIKHRTENIEDGSKGTNVAAYVSLVFHIILHKLGLQRTAGITAAEALAIFFCMRCKAND